MAAADLTAARLRELLHYDPETGLFTWLTGPRAWRPAGCRQAIGYIVIRLDRTLYYGHRLAWLHTFGTWPLHTLDHIDGIKANNRIANLRDVPHAVNSCNHHKGQGRAKLLGAAWNCRTKNWRGVITRNDKQIHLGTFPDPEGAHQAYLAARKVFDQKR